MRTAETSLKENSVESRGDERIQVLKQVCAKTGPRFHRLATNCAGLKLSSQGEEQGMQQCSWLGSLSSWTAPAPAIRVSGPLYNICASANFAKGNQNTTKPKAVSVYCPGPQCHIGRFLVGLRNRAGSPSLLWKHRTDIICTQNVQTISKVAQNLLNILNVAQSKHLNGQL